MNCTELAKGRVNKNGNPRFGRLGLSSNSTYLGHYIITLCINYQKCEMQNNNCVDMLTCLLVTSAKEVIFLPNFVCLCVSKITQKVMDGSF